MALILSTCLYTICENVDIASLQAPGIQKNYNKMCDINRQQKTMHSMYLLALNLTTVRPTLSQMYKDNVM